MNAAQMLYPALLTTLKNTPRESDPPQNVMGSSLAHAYTLPPNFMKIGPVVYTHNPADRQTNQQTDKLRQKQTK